MASKHKHIAFLCGHFNRDKTIKADSLQEMGWQRVKTSNVSRQVKKHIYYPEFVDFCFADSVDEGCVRFTKRLDAQVDLKLDTNTSRRSGKFSFTVKELNLYFMPLDMVLFSIHVEQETSILDECSSLLYGLRFLYMLDKEPYNEYRDLALMPIIEVYNLLKAKKLSSATQLVDNGNKFRVFQVIHSPASSMTSLNDDERMRLLYELATFSKVNDTGADDRPPDDYLKKVMSQYSVTVFDRWTALALLDSFTIHAYDSEKFNTVWLDCYFGMIYIHALFQKSCLYNFNISFKKALGTTGGKYNKSEVNRLVGEYEKFERSCCFNKISYNFLPPLISDAIDDSLEINDEMSQLFHVMDKERKRNDDEGRKQMNSLLIGISFLTIFSAICDATSLINEVYNYESHFGSSIKGFRIFGCLMSLIVLIVLIWLYKRKK